ncbi:MULTISPECIES: GFA family protein [Rhizobium/Agrobacterium group]|uniref:GFA family protein n=1 Tax=Rhizobium/Agrobacterium group TaxID=227290 RepID=UPI000B403041|nr:MULTISPECIES: GFA family protein [Rhizobium/Agrobacterium group]MCF1459937.1 GFA family protein [Allorhizobium ampelinum]MCF1482017.1 GFA family protein [Allorhizobium ampelinum]NSZ42209.1 GFA family protein [Agrobacterium vitis]NTA25917.1 GFA family protein [Allorhizobium ampelinum]OVE95995.1 aldehyde-activating protein [Allorhizobium ampelinum]
MAETVYTGGCQCGAIRFRVEGVLKDSSICHCRMCQKAFGAYYAPLVSTRGAQLNWTRGALKHFQSSNMVKRGFCDACGTPLTYDAPDGVAVSAGAFDDPSILPPTIQYGIESKIGFVDKLHELPNRNTEEDLQSAAFLAQLISYQHPDHDTETWPTESGAKP